MSNLRLEELSARTIVAANSLTLRRGQEQFIVPISYSIADAYVDPSTTWARVIVDADQDDKVVGFVRGNFDPNHPKDEFKACVWRVNVDADEQGKGIGTFAVRALLAEARQRGFDRITAIWEYGDLGPGAFFTRCGFTQVGETEYGEAIGELAVA
ncbi:MAG: hypothetical protein RL431_289 [Actinomycetota bacterium]|jgi:diamine N-acetyltransferase|nr:diamine N-acetyltransferase [Microbacteriaceae bacterium MWH-Ta3]